MPTTTSEHLDNKMKLVLCMIPYFGWIPALAFLYVEKDHKIRWYALQSVYFHLVLALINFIAIPMMRMSIFLLPVIVVVSGIVGVGFLIVCLYGCMQLYNDHDYKIPVISYLVGKTLRDKHAEQ